MAFKYKIEGDQVEDLLIITSGRNPEEKAKQTEETCVVCGSSDLIRGENWEFFGTNNQKYQVGTVTCPVCGMCNNVKAN